MAYDVVWSPYRLGPLACFVVTSRTYVWIVYRTLFAADLYVAPPLISLALCLTVLLVIRRRQHARTSLFAKSENDAQLNTAVQTAAGAAVKSSSCDAIALALSSPATQNGIIDLFDAARREATNSESAKSGSLGNALTRMNATLLNGAIEFNKKDGNTGNKLKHKTSFTYTAGRKCTMNQMKRKQSLAFEPKQLINPTRKRSLPLDVKKRTIEPILRTPASIDLKLSNESLIRKPRSPDAGQKMLSRSSGSSIKFKRTTEAARKISDKSENTSLKVIHEGTLLQGLSPHERHPSSSHTSTPSLKREADVGDTPNNDGVGSPTGSPMSVLKKSESQRFFSTMNMSTSISENYLELVLRHRLEQSDMVKVAQKERTRKVSIKNRAVRGAWTAVILALAHAAFYLPAGAFGLAFYQGIAAGANPRLLALLWACYLFTMCWSGLGSLVNIFIYIARIPAFRRRLMTLIRFGRKRRRNSARQFSELTPSGSSYYF